MDLVKPPKLIPGNLIGVVAPACPFPQDDEKEYLNQYQKGKAELESMGFKVIESKNIHEVHWWSAGTPEQRAQDINEMYGNKEVKAIIAHDGANDCITVLEHIDYDLVKKNPKPFIGFSNITNIHSALYTKLGLVGFHMDLLSYGLGKFWQLSEPAIKKMGIDYFYKILTSGSPLDKIEPIGKWENWKSGMASGRLFGGNLSMLDSLIGTPYFPSLSQLNGSILFWEIDDSPGYRIERVLIHLKYAGVLDEISGMIIGNLVDIKPSTQRFQEPKCKEIVLELLTDFEFPILANVDFGHKMVQIPMPIGINVEIDSENLLLRFTESAVK